VIEDWATWEWQCVPETNEWWQAILAIERRLLADASGRYFVGIPEIGDAADLLSLMRGMDRLAIDLIDCPGAVRHASAVMTDLWVRLHEEVHQMSVGVNDGGGVLAWMSLWAPGRQDQLANDFSSVISTRTFREFFLPEIQTMGDWAECGTYHLDGQKCIKTHLDFLLTIPQIDTIEFTPGSGQPPTFTPAYIPLYKKIQAAGKNLYLLAQPDEVEPLLAELSPEGLLLCVPAESEDDADALLTKAAHWSARGNTFAVAR
jgi:5-methyltetrahydrofolate--homocysteine methyltransferase